MIIYNYFVCFEFIFIYLPFILNNSKNGKIKKLFE